MLKRRRLLLQQQEQQLPLMLKDKLMSRLRSLVNKQKTMLHKQHNKPNLKLNKRKQLSKLRQLGNRRMLRGGRRKLMTL